MVLLSSTEEHPVCWSLGHGEPDPDDEFTDDGLGAIRLELEGLNYKVRKLEIAKTGIDRECQVVVVARPNVDWFPYEREALAAYVAEGGRVLMLLDAGEVPELAGEMERYGAKVGEDVVIDLNRKNQMLGVDDPSFVVLSAENFGEHTITRNLAAALVMPIARSVRAVPEPPAGITVQDLLRTSPDAWGETDPSGASVQPDEGIEVVGEVPVMAVVEVADPAALKVTPPGTVPDGQERLEGAPDPADLARGVPADFAPKAGGADGRDRRLRLPVEPVPGVGEQPGPVPELGRLAGRGGGPDRRAADPGGDAWNQPRRPGPVVPVQRRSGAADRRGGGSDDVDPPPLPLSEGPAGS